ARRRCAAMGASAQELARCAGVGAIPVPAAILTYGESVHGRSVADSGVENDVADAAIVKLDLRKITRDPMLDGAAFDQGGARPIAILSVHAQASVMDATKKAMHGVFDATELLAAQSGLNDTLAMVSCNAGRHRLNYALIGENGRVFNAQTLRMHGVKSRGHSRVAPTAETWAACPWAFIPEPMGRGYAHDVVAQRGESQVNYDAPWDTAAAINRDHETIDGRWVLLAGAERDSSADMRAKPRPSGRRPATPPRDGQPPQKAQLTRDARSQPPKVPTSPSTAPPSHCMGIKGSAAAAMADPPAGVGVVPAASSDRAAAALSGLVAALQTAPAAPPTPGHVLVPPAASPFAVAVPRPPQPIAAPTAKSG
ncbi:unnamed protein product, partial [Prorocentrum cordatum]